CASSVSTVKGTGSPSTSMRIASRSVSRSRALENSTSMGPKAQALSSPASGVRPTISSTSSSSSPAPPRPPSPPAGLLPFDPFPEQETAQTPAANMTAAQLTDLIMALLMTHAPANDRDSEATPSLRRQEQRKASRAGK